MPTLIVHAPCGPVSGIERPNSIAFLGIPYAEAPIGALRFQAPVRRAVWTEVRDCTAYGATPQRRSPFPGTTIPEPIIPGEDILNLNVFTPSTSGSLPVHVYIHGGGYVAGSHVGAWFDGATYNIDDIVVVTISYRLGFDGFGWIEDAPRNRGLRDMVMALEWVRDNIASFGGDPKHVTISGQSAGGGAVLSLLATPAAQGLFQGVIAHSPVIGAATAAQHEAMGRDFAAACKVEPTVAGWSTLTEEQILDVQFAPPSPLPMHPMLARIETAADALCEVVMEWAPAIDADTMPVPPFEAWSKGFNRDVHLVIGSTADEFVLPIPIPAEAARAALATAILPGALHNYAMELDASNEIDLIGRVATTVMFRRNVLDVAAARSKGGAHTWIYDFVHRSSVTGRSGHCLELPFTWNCLDAENVEAVLGPDQPQQLANSMHNAWVRFIATGDPGWQESGPAGAGIVFGDDGGRSAYADVRALVGASPKV